MESCSPYTHYHPRLHGRNKEVQGKNVNSLQPIYSFISNYVLKEENESYGTDDNEYSLLSEEDMDNVYTMRENDLEKGNITDRKKKEKGKRKKMKKKSVHITENLTEIDVEKNELDVETEETKYEDNQLKEFKESNGEESSEGYSNIEDDENEEEEEEEDNIKSGIKHLSKYFNLSLENLGEAEEIFRNEKKLTKQMSYYNDAYYYTSEIIYKDNKKSKQKFALYLRLISLFINIIIGIYLITNFPHTNPNIEINYSARYTQEHEQLKKDIIKTIEINKKYEQLNKANNKNRLISESENLQKKPNYFPRFFLRNDDDKKFHEQRKINEKSHNITNERNENNGSFADNIGNKVGLSVNKEDDTNNFIKEIDILNLIADENIMEHIYVKINKIYNYILYSFFGELLAISVFLFSLFILKVLIQDNNKFSVILTIYGILYKMFCYVFAHYVLFMGIYILSIYLNIYINRDIYENSFNFVFYHFVYNNLFIHCLMLFYAFQNILFTINDTFNSLRMFFIVFKHLMIKIYDKITCQNFVTFYEIKEDKNLLPSICFSNIIKNKCINFKQWCSDKNCSEVDIDEESIGYTNRREQKNFQKKKLRIQEFTRKKSYAKNMDLKTYEQSLINMKNPLIKYNLFTK